MKKAAIVSGLLMALMVANPQVWSEDCAELAKGVGQAKVSLGQGLAASGREGKPISAKFEMEEGQLQLSVYTAKGEKFSEVIVDHNTGNVTKTEAITSGEDLAAAKAQSKAMPKAKESLRAALGKVLRANQGFRVASIFPSLKDGHPVAEIALVKGEEWKTASEKLD